MGGITEKDSKAIFELSQLIQWTKYDIHDPQGNDRKVLKLNNISFRLIERNYKGVLCS